MQGQKTLIDIGAGVVSSDAIAAIIKNGSENYATVILKSGGHLPATRAYEKLVVEMEYSLKPSSLAEFVPEIAAAMQALQGRFAPPSQDTGESEPTPEANEKGTIASDSEKP